MTGVPLLGHTLVQLAAVGCEAVAINLHHLGDQIRAFYGDGVPGLPITWSEEPELLGTLGACGKLRDFFAPADLVLLINGDSLCRWPLASLLRRHRSGGAAATLLLASRPAPAAFGGGVGIDATGRVVSFWPGDPPRGEVAVRHVFAGAHVFAPGLLAGVAAQPADIVRQLYVPRLDAGETLQTVVTARRWHDLGTPQRYLEAVVEAAGSGWIAPDATVDAGAQVRRSAVEAGAHVEAGARVERSVLLPGARVGAGSVVREAIVGFGAEISPGSRVERCLVMSDSEGGMRNL